MFPAGRAGIALLLLRLVVAGACTANGVTVWPSTAYSWLSLVFLFPAILLAAGFLTPYGAGLCCFIQSYSLMKMGLGHNFPIVVTLVNSAAVALSGPGRYSIDAMIFGRHLVVIPPRKSFTAARANIPK